MSFHADKDVQSSSKKHVRKSPNNDLSPQHTPHNTLQHLQNTVGNQALQRMLAQGAVTLSSNTLQAKMTVGASDDKYEQEADAVAHEVMTMPDTVQREENFEEDEPPIQMKIQREENFEEDEPPIQMKSEEDVPGVSNDVEDTINTMKGGGNTMPDSTREFFEPRFGQEFSNVNIHTGNDADHLNRSLNARAFTTGSDIFFRNGEYNPDSNDGRELLAHELTHVVQQGASDSVQKSDDDKNE